MFSYGSKGEKMKNQMLAVTSLGRSPFSSRFWSLFWLCAGFAVLPQCRQDSAPIREIRAHTLVKKGVSHGEPLERPRRYCIKCHGDTLQGGSLGEPSCFSCHGVRWLDDEIRESQAPANHTVKQESFFHHPDLRTPEQSCSPCHGADLQGNTQAGLTYPGCELCHARLWESAN
jgi:hypothetical protein